MVILLDTCLLGMVTHPVASKKNNLVTEWLKSLLSRGIAVAVPEIADYELRRELIRAGKSIERLDQLEAFLDYIPITTEMMRKAADLWAQARIKGRRTAPDNALDGDVILAAQALLSAAGHGYVVVATTNTKHLDMFVDARSWEDIS